MKVQSLLLYRLMSEPVKVLVPGAGLGRLAWELANLGYTCQGNEFSFFMLLASNFILNKYALPMLCNAFTKSMLAECFVHVASNEVRQ